MSYLGYLLLRLIYLTSSWKVITETPLQDNWFDKEPAILSFWHGHQLAIPIAFRFYKGNKKSKLHVLISAHRDGRLIADAIKNFGIDSVEGSSSKFAVQAGRELIRLIKNGHSIAITPDGPKGPRKIAKDGSTNISRITNTPIFPMAFYASKVKIFNSWDKMKLPLPFSKGVIYISSPLMNPSADELQNALNQAEEKAKNLL